MIRTSEDQDTKNALFCFMALNACVSHLVSCKIHIDVVTSVIGINSMEGVVRIALKSSHMSSKDSVDDIECRLDVGVLGLEGFPRIAVP